MRLAVMQPYFLPYIGYFQLIAAVDKFVVYDDVSYINRGWVNRNRILLNGSPHTFTVPLHRASQNRLICDIDLIGDDFWREKLLRTISQAYAKAPFYEQVSILMEQIIQFPERNLHQYLLNSLNLISGYLSLRTQIISSSRIYNNSQIHGQERILDICRQEGATSYFNAIGGEGLYDRSQFNMQGIELKFLRSRPVSYLQSKKEFVPWLSILDVLMFNSPAQVLRLLNEVDLV